jgi:arylsulfatase A-like enzyme
MGARASYPLLPGLFPCLLAGAVGTALADASLTVHALDGELVRPSTRVATFVEAFGIILFPAVVFACFLSWAAEWDAVRTTVVRVRTFISRDRLPTAVAVTIYAAVGAVTLTQAAVRVRPFVCRLHTPEAAVVSVVITIFVLAAGLFVADRVACFIADRTTAFWSRRVGKVIARASVAVCAVVAILGLRDFLPNDGRPFLAPLACGGAAFVLAHLARATSSRLDAKRLGRLSAVLLLASAATYPALARLPGRVRTAVNYRSPLGASLLALLRNPMYEGATRSALAATSPSRRPAAELATPATPLALPLAGPPPNIVVLHLDAVRPDRLGFAGYAGANTPVLDRFRRDAIWFRTTYTPAPSTRYVVGSLFTGLSVERVRAAQPTSSMKLGSHTATLAEELERLGYDRIGVTVPYILSRMPGYGRGFRVWESAWSGEHDYDPPRDTWDVLSADAVLEQLEGTDQRNRPFFLFGHLMCAHAPYPDTSGDDGARYDEALRLCDAQVGRILDALAMRAGARQTAVVLLSDHGELLGEHGLSGHGTSLYEPALRSLLLARLPGMSSATIDAPVSLTGVHAMLLALAGARAPAGDAERLLDLARGEGALVTPHPLFTVVDDQVGLVRYRAHGVIDGQYKYIRDAATGSELVFDLAADPGEHRNVRRSRAEVRTKLARELDAWLGDSTQTPPE